MKKWTVLIAFLAGVSVLQARAQGFLHRYEQYLKRHQNRAAKQERTAEIQLLRELFAAYKQRTGHDLDEADTLHIVVQTGTEIAGYAPDAGRIWNRTDTISFRIERASEGPAQRVIRYEPWPVPPPAYDRYADIGEDSLVALVSRQQFAQAQELARNHPANDGHRSWVTSAIKHGKGYRITHFILPAFGLIRGEKAAQ